MTDPRLFFALWPDAQVRDELASRMKKLQPREGHSHHPDDLHMTLVFLGPVADESRDSIERAADNVVAHSFELQIDRCGFWAKPRILWTAPENKPMPLIQLVKDLNVELMHYGYKPETRAYKPHVTLYRKAQGAELNQLLPAIRWVVSEFVLASSTVPGASTTRYQILKRWTL
jgi:RNA 2',3'-cyclic 3'-phosphodiesterase